MTAANVRRLVRDEIAEAMPPAAAAPAVAMPRPVVAPDRAPGTRSPERRGVFSPATAFFLCVVAILAAGYGLPSSDYLSPQSGAGYALGIVGGSLMLLLLVYPVRKRLPQARYLGSTRLWFRVHMVLGVLGPAAILLHSNFSFGATNSNVALVCMLVVAGSGLFGRYFYRRIHLELHGHQATFEELKAFSGRMRQLTSATSCLAELARRIDLEEDAIARRLASTPMLLRPIVCAAWATMARRRLRRTVRGLAGAAGQERNAHRYIDDRIYAARRMLEFRAFERLFSLWHALHMPLFVMLVIAGVVHVFAVHLY